MSSQNPFTPTGNTVTFNATSTPATGVQALGSTLGSTQYLVQNAGSVVAFIGVGSTAVGRVVSYDKNTGVLKYWQDRTLFGFSYDGLRTEDSNYGIDLNNFTSSIQTGGSNCQF